MPPAASLVAVVKFTGNESVDLPEVDVKLVAFLMFLFLFAVLAGVVLFVLFPG